ncbi:MAG: SpoVR family protein, partial [Planctomycetota bacterium]
MPFSTYRPLPKKIRALQDSIEAKAAEYGLDFFETIFEMVDYDEMSMLAAYGGFPVRYPHWRFGAEYDEMTKSYSYGLSKIYEMVVNTDPCYAYLLTANELADQKLVIAHVYGHCDFFKCNAWFSKTNRRMLDQMANHAARINRYVDRFGHEAVETFIDRCLSVEDLIDPHLPFATPREEVARHDEEERRRRELAPPTGRFDAKGYMDEFVNPREALERTARDREAHDRDGRTATGRDARTLPERPERDVLLFLLDHAPLKDWQHDVLSIIRDEAYYY